MSKKTKNILKKLLTIFIIFGTKFFYFNERVHMMKLNNINYLVLAGGLFLSTASFGMNPTDSEEWATHKASSTSIPFCKEADAPDALKTIEYSKMVGKTLIMQKWYDYCDENGEYHHTAESFYETTYKLKNSCFEEIKIVKLKQDFGIVLKAFSLDILQKSKSLNQDIPLEYNEDSLEITIAREQLTERLNQLFETQNESLTPKLYNDIATHLCARTEQSVSDCLCYEFNTLSKDFTNTVFLNEFKELFGSLANNIYYRDLGCTKFLLNPDLKPYLSYQPFLELYIDLFGLLPKPSRFLGGLQKIHGNIKSEIANACYNFYSQLSKESEDDIALKFYKQTLYFSMGKEYQSLANKAFQGFTSSSPSDSLCSYEGPNIIVTKESLDTIVYMSKEIRKLNRNQGTNVTK